jgi:hypothetical protein
MRRENPYVGPRSFDAGERLFGRDRETHELVDLLIAERIVLLSSPSGAGKSSLINAAVLPRLRELGFEIMKPRRVRDWSAVLIKEPENTSVHSVLVFDQFEEILTGFDTPGDAARLFERIGSALKSRSRWALFSMRDEYVAALQPYERSIPTRFANRYRLDVLKPDAAREAIVEPAKLAGVAFDPAAADALIQNLSIVRAYQQDGSIVDRPGDRVEPVQMQVVCRCLWEALPDGAKTVTLDDVRNVGDVTRALTVYYEKMVTEAAVKTSVPERSVREWIEHALITPQGIRGEIMETPGNTGGLRNETIAALGNAYIVRSDTRRNNTWWELAHDRLIDPIRDSNTRWLVAHLSVLQRQAATWNAQSRASGLLLRGHELVEAERWAAANDAELLPVEKDFLAACRDARATEERIRAATTGTLARWGWTAAERNAATDAQFQEALLADSVLDAARDATFPDARHAVTVRCTVHPISKDFIVKGALSDMDFQFGDSPRPTVTIKRARVAFDPAIDGALARIVAHVLIRSGIAVADYGPTRGLARTGCVDVTSADDDKNATRTWTVEEFLRLPVDLSAGSNFAPALRGDGELKRALGPALTKVMPVQGSVQEYERGRLLWIWIVPDWVCVLVDDNARRFIVYDDDVVPKTARWPKLLTVTSPLSRVWLAHGLLEEVGAPIAEERAFSGSAQLFTGGVMVEPLPVFNRRTGQYPLVAVRKDGRGHILSLMYGGRDVRASWTITKP